MQPHRMEHFIVGEPKFFGDEGQSIIIFIDSRGPYFKCNSYKVYIGPMNPDGNAVLQHVEITDGPHCNGQSGTDATVIYNGHVESFRTADDIWTEVDADHYSVDLDGGTMTLTRL